MVWDFKGKADNSQVKEKEQTYCRQILAEPPETGTWGSLANRLSSFALCLPYLVYLMMLRCWLPSFKVFPLNL